jgi:hypothetical protein
VHGEGPTQALPSAGRAAGQLQISVPNPVPSRHAQVWFSAWYEQAWSKLMLLPFASENVAQLVRVLLEGLCGHDSVPQRHPSTSPPHRQASLPY